MNRRSMITASAAALALPVPALGRPRDPLPALYARWKEVCSSWEETEEESTEAEALWKRREEIGRTISMMQATSLEGVVAQLGWVLEDGRDFFCCDEHRVALEAALRGIEAAHVHQRKMNLASLGTA